MEIALDEATKRKNMMTKHDIASSKQKFESDDSEGSDLSYESSVTDDEDNNVGRIDFFKEEMARFFINYPELINKNILQSDHEIESENQEGQKDKFNRNWQSIADQIFNEAKDPSISLEALAKRISLYRYKLDQEDIIDLLLQQKTTILKEIQVEMAHKKTEKSLIGQNEKQISSSQKQFREDNLYYSWRKRKQFQFKVNGNKGKNVRSESTGNKEEGMKTQPQQKAHRSLHKSQSQNHMLLRQNSKTQSIKPSIFGLSRGNTKRTNTFEKEEPKHLDQPQTLTQTGQRLTSNWRHLMNFEPQTEIGRQLSEDIRKKNSAGDQLGIKKTIIQFLVNYKELINNEVINKVTLSQKIQKLYTEDAKQLLMFYPSKIGSYDSNPATSCNTFKDNIIDDKFVDLLKNVAEGPLIKYWRELQENKV